MYRRGSFVVFEWTRPSEWETKSYDFEMSSSGNVWNPIASNIVDTKFIMDTESYTYGFVGDIPCCYRITAVGEHSRSIPKVVTCDISKLEGKIYRYADILSNSHILYMTIN